MTATRKPGHLCRDDLIHVEHQHEAGTPCCGEWDTDAIVDGTHVVGDLIAIDWHTKSGTQGVTAVLPDEKIRYLGHAGQAA